MIVRCFVDWKHYSGNDPYGFSDILISLYCLGIEIEVAVNFGGLRH